MPPIETADRHQTAVLWSFTGYDDHGQPTVDNNNPVELKVRWTTKREGSLDANGNTIALDVQAVVDRKITPGSIMRLGTLSEWLGTGSFGEDSELMAVVTYGEVYDLKGREVYRTVGLRRHRDDLP